MLCSELFSAVMEGPLMKEIKILKILLVVLSVCLCGQTLSAQVSGGGAIVAIDERTMAAGGSSKSDDSLNLPTTSIQTKGTAKKSPTNKKTTRTTTNTSKKVAPKPAKTKTYSGPVIGDKYSFLNFEISSPARPIHTIAAQQAGAKGLVQVEVLISEDGSVLEAQARTGNKLLHPEAEKAELATRFNRPNINNQPARAMGFIVFRFGPAED
jgi:hypothetical protein